MNTDGADVWTTRLGLWAAVLLALVNLPAQEMPWPWLCAFTLPAALLGALRQRTQRPFLRALLAVVLQTGACILALTVADPLARPAALACTILPPMAFVTVRGQFSDAALGLFLGFCVLLVGVILNGMQPWLLLSWIVVATVALRGQARQLVLREAKGRSGRTSARPRHTLVSALALAPLCALLAFAIDRSLALLPSPSRNPTGAPASGGSGGGRSTVGLSDEFLLDGGGRLIDLQGDRLVRADCDSAAPTDLYLRSGFFEVPALSGWGLGNLTQREHDTRERAWQFREVRRGAPLRRLEIESYQGARNFVFVPPGACSIRGIGDLLGDPRREWFRQPTGATTEVYEISWQNPTEARTPWTLDLSWRRDGLLALPADLDQTPFRALLAEWQPRGTAIDKAERIARGLAERCRYQRSAPVGPHRHELLNFLFAPTDRHGYCMHFASAAAFLLRMSGVPCRIGVGLHGGEPVENNVRARTFGSQHAHAWVEIPFEEHGWVVFDPTPPSERGRQALQRTDLGTEGATPAAPTTDDRAGQAWERAVELLAQPWPWAIVLALVVALSLWPVRRREDRGEPLTAQARPARRLLVQLLRQLAAIGHPRLHGQTLEEYVRTLQGRAVALPELQAAVTAYQEVRFGGRTFDTARLAALQTALTAAAALADARALRPLGGS